MNYKNEIAIELTKKLEHEIVFQFYNNRESPSYFNIRRTILDILDKYLEVFTINEKISPHTIKEMPENHREDYLHHLLEKKAAYVAQGIFKRNDIIVKTEFNHDGYDYFKSLDYSLMVVKLNSLMNTKDYDKEVSE